MNLAEWNDRVLRRGFRALATLAALFAFAISASAADAPAIHVGSELDFRPYCFTDKDGQPTGFGVELLRTVADKMGLRLQITPGPWDEQWADLVAGRIDVLPVVARTSGREPLVDFSLPHTETFDAFFVREGQSAFPNLVAAAGKQIVVLREDAAHHQLVERKFAGQVIPVESIPDGLRLVAAGRHDAFLCSKMIGLLEMRAAGIRGVTGGPPIPDYKRVFSFGVRKGNAELVEKLNQGLLIVKTDGTYEQIYRRWLTVEDPWSKWLPYFKVVVAGLLVLAGLVVLLQLLVRRRTRELKRATVAMEAEVAERRHAQAALQQLNATLEQRVAERTAEVREAEREKSLILENANEVIAYHDTGNNLIWANKAYLDATGLPLSELKGRKCYSCWGLDRLCEQCPVRTAIQTGETQEAELTPENQPHWPADKGCWLIKAAPVKDAAGTVIGAIEVAHDFTARKAAEEELERERKQLWAVIESLDEAVGVWNTDGSLALINDATAKLYGFELKEQMLKHLSDYADVQVRTMDGCELPPEEWPPSRVLRGETFSNWELEQYIPSINKRFIGSNSGGPVRDVKGKIILGVTSVRDITERKQAEEVLAAAHRQTQSLIDNTTAMVYACDLEGRFVLANAALAALLRTTPAQLLGKRRHEFMPHADADAHEAADREVIAAGQAVEFEEHSDLHGRSITWLSTKFPLRDAQERIYGVAGIVTDITARKLAEDALQKTAVELASANTFLRESRAAAMNLMKDAVEARQAVVHAEKELQKANCELELRVAERTRELEKTLQDLQVETVERIQAVEILREKEQMLIQQSRQAAMGEMIGNIAHQWRQPLNTLGLFTQRLGLFYGTPRFNKEFLDSSTAKSMEIIQHMSKTIDDFRDYFKPEKDKSNFYVIEAIKSTLSLLESNFHNPKIAIDFVEHDNPVINGYQNEFAQVFLNILNNARDAVIERGVSDPRITITICSEDNRAVVTVTDNAGGIPEEVINKVFDPYFTTKGPQAGTGIGLFMSKTIIEKNMGGRLTVRNTDTGAEFKIEVEHGTQN